MIFQIAIVISYAKREFHPAFLCKKHNKQCPSPADGTGSGRPVTLSRAALPRSRRIFTHLPAGMRRFSASLHSLGMINTDKFPTIFNVSLAFSGEAVIMRA